MDNEILEENIKITTDHLLELVKKNCWNIITNRYQYILTDVNSLEYINLHELRKIKQKTNSKKTPQNLNSIVETLAEFNDDLYDVVLYVFKAKNNKTIIEIEYLKKSDLDLEYYQKIKDNLTMFHAKIIMPPHQNQLVKFDANWQNNNVLNSVKKILSRFK
ncbi:hypothetical protein [Chryseobacterium sp. CFS15]|uniref:hypothetical protein n=1 Tax=Chryseobacterium sp. CFS15 TaxID=2986946 RepID=UPI0028072534|nr:hypothetical protein [Chryseobacterium sp. CFS15]MDQ8140564.1 hypothetical protein [Chryseobacterium sp. CFS15]